MIKNYFILISCLLLCVLSNSCKKDDVVIVEGKGNLYETTIQGISIKITPIVLKCGEDITIEVSSKTNNTNIVVSSETLDIYETLTTPSTLRKTLTVEGHHELKFFTETGLTSILTSITIDVKK